MNEWMRRRHEQLWSIHITRFQSDRENQSEKKEGEGNDFERIGENCTNMTIRLSIDDRGPFRFVGHRRKKNIIQNTKVLPIDTEDKQSCPDKTCGRRRRSLTVGYECMWMWVFSRLTEKSRCIISVKSGDEERSISLFFTKLLSLCMYLYLDINIIFLIPVHSRWYFAVMIIVVLEKG